MAWKVSGRRAVIAIEAVSSPGIVVAVLLPSGAGAAFTQCPPVDVNKTGCQFLVTVTSGGTSVAEDPTAGGPYEGADDALIGVQNNSSGPVSSVHLSAENELFGFEADGICSVGAIVDQLAAKYAAPREAIATDVVAMLQDLADKGFLTAAREKTS